VMGGELYRLPFSFSFTRLGRGVSSSALPRQRVNPIRRKFPAAFGIFLRDRMSEDRL